MCYHGQLTPLMPDPVLRSLERQGLVEPEQRRSKSKTGADEPKQVRLQDQVDVGEK